MDITYCNDQCPVGKRAQARFIEENNSAFDAAIDFRFFIEDCFKSCPYKGAHDISEEMK